MKAIEIMVLYGKNKTFVDRSWVAENAVENFKAYWENNIHNVRNWKKEITFKIDEYDPCEIAGENDEPMGTIYGFTKNGFRVINITLK